MRIVAITSELMDRSRISGALDGVEFARDAAACAGADVVVVDVARDAALVAAVRAAAPDARIVAFGPHVDTEVLDQASRDGADVVLPRSKFFQDPAGALAPWLCETAAMPDYPLDTTVTDHLLSTTRAVRKRLDLERPVEREVLLECLRLAVQSPTGSNAQKWHWIVVTDAGKRARLKELYDGMARPYLESQADAAEDAQTRRVYQSAVYLLNILDQVPVHVIPCVEGRLESPEPFAAASFYGSILPAVWSFMLAARSRGLGTVWTTLHLANEAETAALLGIPDGMTQVALIPVAYYTGDDFKPAARPPVEDITYWDSWGAT